MNPSRTKCLTPEEIEELLTDQAALPTRQELEQHLATCPRCQQEMEEQREFDALRRSFTAVSDGPPPVVRGHVVHHRLGRGAFGEVWLGYYPSLEQWRGLKVLRSDRFDAAALANLRREAKVMASLKPHRNRVQVYDLIEQDGTAVLAMAYIDGGSLRGLGRLNWERAVRYVADAADGLVEVHEAGLRHGDLKPGNLLWDRQRDAALVGDYGLAAHATGPQTSGGTFGYAAPEVLEGKATVKSDVFALAATLQNLLAEFPPGVVEVIRSGLEPDETRRPGLDEFRAMLRRVHVAELADALRQQARASTCPVRLHVKVETADAVSRGFRPVLSHSSAERDAALTVEVRTGDLVQIEAVADADGHTTILHFSSSGELAVLLPEVDSEDSSARAGEPQWVAVQMTPPAGIDRFAVIWTRWPSRLKPEQWREQIAAGLIGKSEEARNAVKVLHGKSGAAADAWTAVVLAVRHSSTNE